jgi:hypothetical protein
VIVSLVFSLVLIPALMRLMHARSLAQSARPALPASS